MKRLKALWAYYEKRQVGINLGLAIFGIFFGIVVYIFPLTPKGHLTVYIQQEGDVQLNKPLDGLKLLYKDVDIRQNKLNLKFYRIRIQNDGNASIQDDSYASQELFGLAFKDAFVLSVHLTATNDPYINREMRITTEDSVRIILSKLILEEGRYYECEILSLYRDNASPSLAVMGKIIGQHEITISNEPYTSTMDGIKYRLRLLIANWKYKLDVPFLWYLIIIVPVALVIVDSIRKSVQRRELLRLYKKRSVLLTDERSFLSSLFGKLSKQDFKTLLDVIAGPAVLKEHYLETLEDEAVIEKIDQLIDQQKVRLDEKRKQVFYVFWFRYALEELIINEFASVDQNNNITITPAMLNEVNTAKLLLS